MKATRPGDLFAGRYRIGQPLGAGGMGTVYAAIDETLDRDVAIKVLHPEITARPDSRVRFAREAKVAATFSHPNAIRIFDFGEDLGRPYLVMERLIGQDLGQKVRAEGRQSVKATIEMGCSVAAVLVAAHQENLIHRDIKPDNVFIEQPSKRVVLLDFGMAFVDHSDNPDLGRLTREGLSGGTPAYMAPEQCGGMESSGATDVYSLGCVLFEALIGVAPFTEKVTTKYFIRHLYDIPERLTSLRNDVPRVLDELVARMLAKQPRDRPTSKAVHQRLASLNSNPKNLQERSKGPSYLANRAARAIPRLTPVFPVRARGTIRVRIPSEPDNELRLGLAAVGIVAEFGEVDLDSEYDATYLIDPDLETVALVVAKAREHSVLVGTEDATIEQIKALLRLGVSDVITRPRSAAQLAAKLRRLRRKRPTTDPQIS